MNKKVSSSIKFNPGDFVVYPAHGVGKVFDIAKQQVAGTELELIVVNFDKDKMTLSNSMASKVLKKMAKCVLKAKNMLFKMAMSCTSFSVDRLSL